MDEKKQPVRSLSKPSIVLLADFPDELIPLIDSVLGKAVRQFKTQDKLRPFLKYVVKQLAPDFRRLLSPGMVLYKAESLVHSVLVSNNRSSDKEAVMQELGISREWAALTEESPQVPDELSYDPKSELFVVCGVPFEKVKMVQYKMFKTLHDVKKKEPDKGLSGNAWLERAGYPSSRIENIWRTAKEKAMREELAPCGSDRLYRFSYPDKGPRLK
jgi:hypothetical protein